MNPIKINTPDLPPPPSVKYEQYTELLSRIIQGCAVPHQKAQVQNFEAAQPEYCPHCGVTVRSPFEPKTRIVHDIAGCSKR